VTVRLPFALLVFLLAVGRVSAAETEPEYLQDLDRPYRSGDWTLQCNSSQFCQIIGIVKVPRDHVGVRAVVMINRGIAKGTKPVLRLAFIDAMGSLGVPPPTEGWRLYSRGLPKMPPPIKLALGEAQPNGAYRASPEVGAKVISALRRWPGSIMRDRGQKVAAMPRGDLDRLFRKMDRLQHPRRPRMTDAEKAKWLKEYHYTILRTSPSEETIPDAVLLSCDTRTYVNQPYRVRIGPQHLLWTASCPEGTKIFVQKADEEPILFEVRDRVGQIQPHGDAWMDENSLLQIHLLDKKTGICGRYLKLGFTGSEFVLIESRAFARCRAVPHDYWPILWAPTSWKYVGPPPTNGGNAPPATEGVRTP
jgi:hypothetical protein